jgi:hypothetical protein
MGNHSERLRQDICGGGRDEIFCDQSFGPSFIRAVWKPSIAGLKHMVLGFPCFSLLIETVRYLVMFCHQNCAFIIWTKLSDRSASTTYGRTKKTKKSQ